MAMNSNLIRDGTLFDYMMEKLDKRYVYLELDVFWIKQAGQDPLELLKKYASRFVLMHLKDRKIGTPNTDNGHGDLESNVVLGSGDVGIAEIMKEAKRLGIKHYFIEDESSNVEVQLPKSLAYLESLELRSVDQAVRRHFSSAPSFTFYFQALQNRYPSLRISSSR